MTAPSPQARAWASSGAMALTGRPDGPPLLAPDEVVDRIAALGTRVGVDPLPLLGQRAAIIDLTRGGARSAGGAARLLQAADGWVVANLPRHEDREAVGAWLEVEVGATDPWEVVAAEVPARPAATLVERGELLGLPVARTAEVPAMPADDRFEGLPVRATPFGPAEAIDGSVLVVDLSSLWAGPLCTRVLADRGARVVKVESRSRPDGARRGPAAFFDALHHGKEAVSVDLGDPHGIEQLRRLVHAANVVVESSRPRALAQHGIVAEAAVSEAGGPQVWVSITGHGRSSDRVAFGDDAAVAGGLVAGDEHGQVFVGDAVADPLTGIAAAAAVAASLSRGGAWLLDVSMAAVAAHVATGIAPGDWRSDGGLDVAGPSPPATAGRGPELGADDASAGRSLGVDLV